MNVSTTATTATTTSSNDVSQTRSSASPKASEKSFDEEMKTQTAEKNEDTEQKNIEDKTTSVDKAEEKDNNEKTDNLNKDVKISDDIVSPETLNGAVNFTDFKYGNENQALLTQNIQNLLDTKNLISTVNSASTFDYDVVNMSESDANFFADLVQHTDMSMNSIASHITDAMSENSQNIQQNVKISSVLMDKLAESMKNNQPFRINFDNDVSVIIKVNKDGSIMANFIPGDKAVEQYLKNNIASLRQRFDDENLSYSELSYSNHKEQQQQKRKKENDNE